VNSSVAAVGSLEGDEVRFVLDSVGHLRQHNSSWTVECTGRGFELRSLAAAEDADARELLIQCGRVILDLRVAVRALGVHATVQLLPEADHPDLIAVVQPQGQGVPAPEDLALLEAIPLVRDHVQHPVVHGGVPAATMTRLRQSAKIEQAWLATLTPDQVQGLWGTGTPLLGSPDPRAGITAVVGSLRDLPTARLQAGQALERVLLTAVAADVHTDVLPAPLFDGAERMRVRDVIGGGLWPQSVIRLGGSPDGAASS
jgi:hypothetical protein